MVDCSNLILIELLTLANTAASSKKLKLSFCEGSGTIMPTFFGDVLSVNSRTPDNEDLDKNEEDKQI